jgi:hypothetical protein
MCSDPNLYSCTYSYEAVFTLTITAIHVAGLNPIFRVICLVIQFGCLIGLTTLAIAG